jgi:hypothetical protein
VIIRDERSFCGRRAANTSSQIINPPLPTKVTAIRPTQLRATYLDAASSAAAAQSK